MNDYLKNIISDFIDWLDETDRTKSNENDDEVYTFIVRFLMDNNYGFADTLIPEFITKHKIFNKIELILFKKITKFRLTTLINQFNNGYCYYFACILKQAFNRGQIVWLCPYDHFAWQDSDNKVYDIMGIVDYIDYKYIIPIKYFTDAQLEEITHKFNFPYRRTKDDYKEIITKYFLDNNINDDDLDNIVEDCII